MDKKRIEKAVRTILEAIGEDPEREGLKGTPSRVAKMYGEILAGMSEDPRKHLRVMVTEAHKEMVLVKDISFYSICEHHLLPFVGKAHVAYIPRGNRVSGLSKLVRVVDTLSRRLQIQERLTTQIADIINDELKPRGVLVVIEAEHLCMTIRGVKRPGTMAVTSAVRGIFKESEVTRAEALSLIKR